MLLIILIASFYSLSLYYLIRFNKRKKLVPSFMIILSDIFVFIVVLVIAYYQAIILPSYLRKPLKEVVTLNINESFSQILNNSSYQAGNDYYGFACKSYDEENECLMFSKDFRCNEGKNYYNNYYECIIFIFQDEKKASALTTNLLLKGDLLFGQSIRTTDNDAAKLFGYSDNANDYPEKAPDFICNSKCTLEDGTILYYTPTVVALRSIENTILMAGFPGGGYYSACAFQKNNCVVVVGEYSSIGESDLLDALSFFDVI